MYAYQPGHLLPVGFQPIGINQIYRVSIKGYTADDLVALFDTTHTGHLGAGTARIAGKPDAQGTLNMDFDADIPPYLIPPTGQPGAGPSSLQGVPNTQFLQRGVSGILLVYVTPNKPIQFPVIIEKLNYASSTDQELKVSIDWKQNVNIGMVVYPTTPGA